MASPILAADLEAHLTGATLRWLGEQGIVQIPQFVLPWGVVDVVGIKPNLERLQARLAAKQTEALLESHAIEVLLSIPKRKKIRIEDLRQTFEPTLGPNLFARAIKSLIKKHFAKQNEDTLTRCTDWMPYHELLIAVELKLKRIDEALAQAKRHKAITPASYVGMPGLIAERILKSERKRAEFQEAGIGLLSIENHVCTVQIKPSNSRKSIIEPQEICAAESCLHALLKAVQH